MLTTKSITSIFPRPISPPRMGAILNPYTCVAVGVMPWHSAPAASAARRYRSCPSGVLSAAFSSSAVAHGRVRVASSVSRYQHPSVGAKEHVAERRGEYGTLVANLDPVPGLQRAGELLRAEVPNQPLLSPVVTPVLGGKSAVAAAR